MRKRGQKIKITLGSLFTGILICVFFLTSLLVYTFMNDTIDRGKRDFINNYSRIPLSLLRYYPDFNDELIRTHRREVIGLILFGEDSRELYRFGEISVEPDVFFVKELLEIERKKELVIVDTSTRFILPKNDPEFLSDQIHLFEEQKFHIHLEIRDYGFVDRINQTMILHWVIQLLVFIFFGFSFIFYARGQRLRKQLEKQEQLATLGGALRTLTHEMKNPLSAIKLQNAFIKKKTEGRIDEETAVVDAEILRLTRLMDTVRNYLNDPVGEPEIISLNAFMNDIRKGYLEGIQWLIPESEVWIYFDKDRLRSILENLVNNALESGSPIFEICVSFRLTGKIVSVSIRDRGKGISPDLKKKIFDPFFTTKTRGSGAGLMIVKRFLTENGSSLDIESQPDKGTEVCFRIKSVRKGKMK